MPTLCRVYATEGDARSAVDRLLEAGVDGREIRVLRGEAARDASDAPLGEFGGTIGAGERVGAYAGAPGAVRAPTGAFAGDPGAARRGGFADADRDTVTTYPAGVARARVASHRRLERLLIEAGVDAEMAQADVEALHAGRILVLVTAPPFTAAAAASALDAA